MTDLQFSVNGKADLLSLTLSELEDFVISLGEPKYRAQQLFSPLHHGVYPDKLTNIGKVLKDKLFH